MKHRVLFTAAVVVACVVSAAPAFAFGDKGSFERGRALVNVGVGPSGSSALYGSAPFWLVTGEVGVSDNLSVGGFVGITGRSGALSGYTNTQGEPVSFDLGYSMYGARASYHLGDFFDDKRYDVYGGVSLGRQSLKLSIGGEAADLAAAAGMTWVYGVHAGGRFFFTPKLAGFVEGSAFQSQTVSGVNQDVTYGPGNVSAGLTLKF